MFACFFYLLYGAHFYKYVTTWTLTKIGADSLLNTVLGSLLYSCTNTTLRDICSSARLLSRHLHSSTKKTKCYYTDSSLDVGAVTQSWEEGPGKRTWRVCLRWCHQGASLGQVPCMTMIPGMLALLFPSCLYHCQKFWGPKTWQNPFKSVHKFLFFLFFKAVRQKNFDT